jgi:predicted SAM-dependent methyltransferase
MKLFQKKRQISKVTEMIQLNKSMKVHLGCGLIHKKEWVNVDIDPRVKPDILAPADDLYMFPDGTVDVIENNHLFEHLSPVQAEKALKEWHRVLKKGGELIFEFPNLARCAMILADKKSNKEEIRLAMIGIYGFPQDFEKVDKNGNITLNVFQMHKWGWTPEKLIKKLKKIGFSKAKQIPATQKHRPAYKIRRDMRIKATK